MARVSVAAGLSPVFANSGRQKGQGGALPPLSVTESFMSCAILSKALNGGTKPARRVHIFLVHRKHSNGKE